ncbi:MAG: Nuclear import receptor [Vezdaea acicularis]|nr:MAG: Nuclear import receptor [Vezdaea acicularis]
MAADGAGTASSAFGPVLEALKVMKGTGERSQKAEAHTFLETFQKSESAWQTTGAMLQASNLAPEELLFAATTLKGKIVYDLHQLPRETLPGLRDSLLALLAHFKSGPRPIRTQLCVCLADLAIQMLEWKNVIQLVVSTLGSDSESGTCILEFLRILPEEVTEGRKINLTEEELKVRTEELLDENAQQVLKLLIGYSQSSASAATNPLLLECITSWLREVGAADVVKSPLLDVIFHALASEPAFDSAVECLCAIFVETREVDEYMDSVALLYPRVLALRPKIVEASADEDLEVFKGYTRIFAEAGEAWVVLIIRAPAEFRGLVEAILECAARDKDKEAVSLTFKFWYELKLLLTIERNIEIRVLMVDIYSKLVDIMIKHLEFPAPESGDETDLFDGDREQEDKFREYRHSMGDVLKDCCEVIGPTECLSKAFVLIQRWVTSYGSQAAENKLPNWQELEAPLFSMRSMGSKVDAKEENTILPQIMPLIVQIPYHEKVRFQSIMAVARYTEWVAAHPTFLDSQLQFIISAFNSNSPEVIRAAALALKFFCQDCRHLLGGYMEQIQQFYDSILDKLVTSSQEEVTEGVASLVAAQSIDNIFKYFKLFCDPVVERLKRSANLAQDDEGKLKVADQLQLVSIFFDYIAPTTPPGTENPGVQYCAEVFPILGALVDNFLTCSPISAPLLPILAKMLTTGFAKSRQGCFLWTTDAIVREFAEGAEYVDKETSDQIYAFFEHQALSFLRALNDLPPVDLPDVIEDFFRLVTDALLYYPNRLILSELIEPILRAAMASLTLQQTEPLTATLHFLRDFLQYGGDNPPNSSGEKNPPEVKAAVKKLILVEGETLTQAILTGMMFHFTRDCFPDASGVLLGLVQLMPNEITQWIARTLQKLPAGTLQQVEAQRLLNRTNEVIQADTPQKVRYLLQDFTNSYRRRNVAPREGLGRLEATRFRFNG